MDARARIVGTPDDPAAGLLARLMAAAPLFGARASALMIEISNETPTMGTDGRRLVVNPEFLAPLTDDDAVIVLGHEACHAHDDHSHRSGWHYNDDGSLTKGRDPNLWNRAADYSVNAKLVACGLATPAAIARLGGLYDPAIPVAMSVEEIYYHLETQQAQQQKQQRQQNDQDQTGSQSPQDAPRQAGDSSPQSDPSEGDDDGSEPDDADADGSSSGDTGDSGSPADSGTPAEPTLADADQIGKFGRLLPAPADYDADEAYQEKMLAECVAEAAGSLPGDLARALHGGAGYTESDWRAVLAQFADTAGRGHTDYTYRRPNYRSSGGDYRVFLPSLTGHDPVRILVALDLSGSISNAVARRYLGEIDAMLATMPDIEANVCSFDTRLHGPWPIRETPDTLPGGGGTDAGPAFELADADGYRALVVMTDGCLDPPAEPTFPVLWMLTCPNANFAPPYGTVAPMYDAWR